MFVLFCLTHFYVWQVVNKLPAKIRISAMNVKDKANQKSRLLSFKKAVQSWILGDPNKGLKGGVPFQWMNDQFLIHINNMQQIRKFMNECLVFIELFFYMTSNKNTCSMFHANTHSDKLMTRVVHSIELMRIIFWIDCWKPEK